MVKAFPVIKYFVNSLSVKYCSVAIVYILYKIDW